MDTVMKTYICITCGYIYDPEMCDPTSDVAVGTAFENLPNDWLCPVCFTEKSDFTEE